MNEWEIAARIEAATGHPFHEKLDCFVDPIEAIVEDVERLKRTTRLAHKDRIRGFMYDLAKNALEEVFARPS